MNSSVWPDASIIFQDLAIYNKKEFLNGIQHLLNYVTNFAK